MAKELKDMSKEEVIEMMKKKTKELYNLVIEVEEQTDYEVATIIQVTVSTKDETEDLFCDISHVNPSDVIKMFKAGKTLKAIHDVLKHMQLDEMLSKIKEQAKSE